ncbi:olfactory receptor 6C3-like [Tachyglossus aculeatus]|uniref:olfactory receptor 6C3-like n=1 Tax=Tachyglossus aculeatus TaxID=9261 RepID=UPI0018F5789C|nr:olfactory receptor 6C3-like [Tachyglossus aculeatus]
MSFHMEQDKFFTPTQEIPGSLLEKLSSQKVATRSWQKQTEEQKQAVERVRNKLRGGSQRELGCQNYLIVFPLVVMIVQLDPCSSKVLNHFICDSSPIMLLSCIFTYITLSAKDRVELNKGVAVLNTSVAPILNSFIYMLRNEQVKQAVRDLFNELGFPPGCSLSAWQIVQITLTVLLALSNRSHQSTMWNYKPVTDFFLLEPTTDLNLQAVILLCMSVTYVMNVTSNLTIVNFTLMNSRLRTPMYFFLRCFSFLEICFTYTCIPSFLATTVTVDRTISYNCCATQLFFFILLRATEFFLLAAMSYDCYVSTCRPQHHTTVMSQRVGTLLALCSCLTGFMVIFPLVILGLQLDFCGSIIIDHFFCDISPLFLLSCLDTWFLEMMALVLAVGTLLFTLTLVTSSYMAMSRAILRLPSTQQRRKAFSTCSSHIVVISNIYGSCILMYIKPSAKKRVELIKGVAVLNTSLAPMLNSFIYTLSNQLVRQAFQGMVHQVVFSSRR